MTSLNRRYAALTTPRWRLPVLLLLLGVIIRFAWLATGAPNRYAAGEISNVAISFAHNGVLADAYGPGQGPTAHVLPLSPVYAGLIYRELGVRSTAAEAVLAASAILIAMGSYALLYLTFGEIGTPRWARLGGLAFACLCPLNFSLEAVDFRIWEGGLAVLAATAVLYALQRLDRAHELATATIAAMALAMAVLFFISPPLALGAYAGALFLLVDRLPWRRWPIAIVIAVAGLAVVLGPWAARNNAVFGEPIPLRSNAGLELAMANHPAAAAASNARDDLRVFRARLKEIHPFASKSAFDAMRRAGGEVPYARQLGVEAKQWIVAHPAGFIRLSFKHLRQYFFPPSWFWHIYYDGNNGLGLKVYAHWALSLAGLAGAVAAAVVATRRYRYALLMLVLPAVPYMIVQPVLRYHYLVYGLIVFFAADLAARLAERFSLRSAPAVAGRSAV